MSGGPNVWLVVFAVLFVVVVVLLGFYAIMRLRRRRQALSLELENTRELFQDRAYNQIRLAQAAADTLSKRGIDVTRCRTLITDAEAARSRGDHDTALALARSSRDAMAKMHESGYAGPPAAPRTTPARTPAAPALSPLSTMAVMPTGTADRSGAGTEASEGPSPPRLPPNKAESHFQIKLLTEELERGASNRQTKAAVKEATALRDLAQAAWDRGDFTEALRLGLKGRRTIGGRLETLPAMSAAATAANPGPSEETLVCTGCGEKLRANDRFCRYCGTLRGPARCPSCGEPTDSDDKFCAKCGAEIKG